MNQGKEAAGVDPGILTFMNHGCDGTYNAGSILPFTEATFKPGDVYAESTFSFYNPFHERHFSYPDCSSNVALRDIQEGEEILCNYLVFQGSFASESGLVEELRRECAGHRGIISTYEQQAASGHNRQAD